MKFMLMTGVLLVGIMDVSAQQVLRLDEVRTAIRAQHPALRMLDAEARSFDEAAKGAYNWMAPELGAGFFMTPYNPEKWKAMNGQPGMGSIMVSAQQMFPSRKRQDAEYAWMGARSSVELQKKDVAINDLMYTARTSYYDQIVLEKKLKILDDNERLLRFMMESATIRYKNGLGKISSYYKAQAALANVENMRIMMQNDILRKQIAINTVMYRDASIPFRVDTSIVWYDFNPAQLDSVALREQRSDLHVIDQTIKVNELEREAELAKLRPEFGIRYDNMVGWGRQPVRFSLMGMVRIPLAKWSSRMNKAKAESIIWENEALRNQQQMIINEAAGMGKRALTELELKRKQMKLYEEQILPALRKNFQTMQLGYEQNTEELFELFDAWEALNMTQMEYLDQLQQALRLQAELMKILEIK